MRGKVTCLVPAQRGPGRRGASFGHHRHGDQITWPGWCRRSRVEVGGATGCVWWRIAGNAGAQVMERVAWEEGEAVGGSTERRRRPIQGRATTRTPVARPNSFRGKFLFWCLYILPILCQPQCALLLSCIPPFSPPGASKNQRAHSPLSRWCSHHPFKFIARHIL